MSQAHYHTILLEYSKTVFGGRSHHFDVVVCSELGGSSRGGCMWGKQKMDWRFKQRQNACVKSIICSSLSAGMVEDVRNVLCHNAGSARKLVGMCCSELWKVHEDRRGLSDKLSAPKGHSGYVKMLSSYDLWRKSVSLLKFQKKWELMEEYSEQH